MRKKIWCVLALLLLGGCADWRKKQESEPVVGMWYSYLDYGEAGFPENEKAYEEQVDRCLENMKSIGVNTVYVHASAFTDAYYESSVYPKAKALSGITYDPLAIWTGRAHHKHMKIEAWINPYRSVAEGEEAFFPETHPIRVWLSRNDERIRPVNGRWYLNPAYPEVRDLIETVIEEILANYEVDGIHFDDYFYPEGVENRFDAYVFSLAEEKNETISREEFRRSQVNRLIKEVREITKAADRTFSISVAGNRDNNLNLYFADPAYWVKEGYIDVLIPQVYWGYEHPVKPFRETVADWKAKTSDSRVKFLVGLASYKIGTEDVYAGNGRTEWQDHRDMMRRQKNTAAEEGCDGVAYFRYGSLFHASPEVRETAEAELDALRKDNSRTTGG